jgi:hypothetical protein
MACYVNPVPTFNLTQHLSPTDFRPAKATVITLQIACSKFGWQLKRVVVCPPQGYMTSSEHT